MLEWVRQQLVWILGSITILSLVVLFGEAVDALKGMHRELVAIRLAVENSADRLEAVDHTLDRMETLEKTR